MDLVSGLGWLALIANAAMLAVNWRLRRRLLAKVRLLDAETQRLQMISEAAGEMLGKIRAVYGIAPEPLTVHPPSSIRLH